MTTDKATARPWIVNVWTTGRRTIEHYIDKKFNTGHPIAEILAQHNDAHKANAALIVKAVNSHDALVEACEHARQFITNGLEYGYIQIPDKIDPANETLPKLEHALALAKGGS